MSHTRTLLLGAAFTAIALTATSTLAQSDYPNKAITMVVPASAGGTTDLAGRMLSQPLGTALGQTVVVDNKAGGNGAIAATQVKRAAADGYTLLMQYSGFHVISPHVVSTQQWQQDDLVPVANVLSAPQIIVVRGDLPVNTLAELVAYAKENPGKLNYASSGNGSLQHVTGVQLEQQAHIEMAHVPYRGTAPALQAHVQAGRLKVLAVTGTNRLAAFPDVPTTAEAGYPGVNASSWFGVFAPKGTPEAVVNKLVAEIEKVTAEPGFSKSATEQGAEAYFEGPADFGKRVAQDWASWGEMVKTSNIRAD